MDENKNQPAPKAERKIEMPKLLSVSASPHIKAADTTQTVMLDVIIALVPSLMWGIHVFGLRALWITLISIGACVIFETLFQVVTKRPVTVLDLSAVVTGLLIAMNLSVSVPLWLPAAGAFFAIIVVKQIFGGIGKNIVNPALAARVFMFAWPTEMGKFTEPHAVDGVTSATPLAALKEGVLPDADLIDMLFGNIGGCIGEVSSILLIVGGIYLLCRKVITWHIPVAYIGTVALLAFVFPQAQDALRFAAYELLAGGLMIGAIFMATDYVTSPITAWGKIIFGIGCGAITIFIRYFGNYPEGVSFSILIMNLLVWYIDKITLPVKFGGKSRVGK